MAVSKKNRSRRCTSTISRVRRYPPSSSCARRFILLIVGAFGVLAFGLAAIGVYGVMSLIVSERTREVGVRLALGAKPSQLLRMIVGQAATLGAIGVMIGLLGALPMALLLRGQLYGVDSIDPATFASVPAA